jgi:TonB family protein
MRPFLKTAIIAFFLGVFVFSPSVSLTQEQVQGKRKVVNQPMPAYPELASKLRITGTVKVEATVAPNGTVTSTQVVGGSPVLVSAAVEAVQKWKWAPAPQETKEIIALNFHP